MFEILTKAQGYPLLMDLRAPSCVSLSYGRNGGPSCVGAAPLGLLPPCRPPRPFLDQASAPSRFAPAAIPAAGLLSSGSPLPARTAGGLLFDMGGRLPSLPRLLPRPLASSHHPLSLPDMLGRKSIYYSATWESLLATIADKFLNADTEYG